jgi:Ca2+-binding RTX toxin-like protein
MPSPYFSSSFSSTLTSGSANIDSLQSGYKWGGVTGTRTSISFSFPWLSGASASFVGLNSKPYSSHNEQNAPHRFGLDSIQQSAAISALEAWSNVAGITFQQVADNSTSVGDIRFAFSSAVSDDAWGWAYLPGKWPNAGDIWINSDYVSDDSWSKGSYNYEALMHEIGHAIGLKHPFDHNPNLSNDLDNRLYTLMSYNDPPRNVYPQAGYVDNKFDWITYEIYPDTPMVLDILAIQYLYGANYSYRATNDIYTIDPSKPFFRTIWDGGGQDTLSALNFASDCIISLTPGSYSSFRYAPPSGDKGGATVTYDGTNNLGVAYGCIIENAVGGVGSDWITGNDANNIIDGGAGNDTLSGNKGDDVIDGGSGSDTATFSAARRTYKIAKNTTGGYSVSSTTDGTDQLSNIEYLEFSDRKYSIEELVLDSTSPNANNRSPTGSISVKGKFSQGGTLTVSNSIADKDGIPTAGSTGAIAYTWFSSNEKIEGATASTLLLTQENVGKAITVKASYTDLLGTLESVTSPASAAIANVNDAPTGSVSISGTATQGQTLSASNTIADLDGVGTISYQWNAGGKAIVGATSDTFTLTQAQVGQTISVSASYTDGFGKKEVVTSFTTSKVSNINDSPTGQLTISGTATEDLTLRAVTTALADIDGLGPLRFQWQSSSGGTTWTSINKATAATYKLGDADVGKYIRATISYTDKLGTAESVLGESSALVKNINDKPISVPTISGKFIEGEMLTANVSRIKDSDGLGLFSYQWQTSTDKKTWSDAGIEATYQLSGTSAKQFVRLIANYTDGNGTAESVNSTASTAIAAKTLTLLGGDGSDTLTGWSGADRITGGGGGDTLTGGAGADIFIYRSVDDSLSTSFDTILDFSAADKIDLKGIDAMTSKSGDQAFVFSRNGAAKNAVWWAADTLYGDNTGDSAADFAIYVNLVGLSDIKVSNIIL